MDVETLQLEVECLLTSSDVDQLSEVGYVLKMGKETLAGLSKLNLLKRVCQKLEEVIEAGNPEDNVELLNELKGQLQGVKPPPLETHDEELKEAEKAVSDTKKKYEALVTEQQKELEKALEKLEIVKGGKGDDLVTKNVAKGNVAFDLKNSLLRREFRIKGQIGEPEQSDKLSFVSLIKQIDSGIGKGYEEHEIIDGVIQAIMPSMKLRSYLETLKGLTLPRLRQILRSHYKEKDSTSLYQGLITMCQGPKESPLSFLFRASDMRQKILFASQEAGSGLSYNPELVQGMFLRCLETGFQDDNIAAKMKSIVADKEISDEDLIERHNEVVTSETERQAKLNSSGKQKAQRVVSSASTSTPTKPSEKVNLPEKGKDQDISSKLLAAVESMQTEIANLKQAVAQQQSLQFSATRSRNHSRSASRPNYSRRGCSSCTAQNRQSQCHHCFLCGSADHIMSECKFRESKPSRN